jgi:hypothetical protein
MAVGAFLQACQFPPFSEPGGPFRVGCHQEVERCAGIHLLRQGAGGFLHENDGASPGSGEQAVNVLDAGRYAGGYGNVDIIGRESGKGEAEEKQEQQKKTGCLEHGTHTSIFCNRVAFFQEYHPAKLYATRLQNNAVRGSLSLSADCVGNGVCIVFFSCGFEGQGV